MWIQYTRTHPDGRPKVRSFKEAWMDEPVSFNRNGKAQVTASVGERLCEERADVEPSGGIEHDEGDRGGEASSEDTEAGDQPPEDVGPEGGDDAPLPAPDDDAENGEDSVESDDSEPADDEPVGGDQTLNEGDADSYAPDDEDSETTDFERNTD